MLICRSFVTPQLCGFVQRSRNHIHPSVVIEISKGTAAMRAFALEGFTGIQRCVSKTATPCVEEQAVRLAIGLFVVQFLVVVDVPLLQLLTPILQASYRV